MKKRCLSDPVGRRVWVGLGSLSLLVGIVGLWLGAEAIAQANDSSTGRCAAFPASDVAAQDASRICSGRTIGLQPTYPTMSQSVAQPPDPSVVAAQTEFGLRLFSQLQQGDPQQNRLISPSSIAIALGMTYNGASGETQQAMANALSLQGLSLETVNQANAALEQSLESDGSIELTIANSLWNQNGFSVQPNFLQLNRDYYQAEINTFDATDPNAAEPLNRWVSDQTRGKIAQIIDRLSPDDVMVLLNAVYFKGNWATAFDAALTRDRPFYSAAGQSERVPMMTQTGSFRYLENDQFQAVSLPYGNGRWSLYVFLPDQTSDLSTFYSALTSESWENWMNQFAQREGTLQLPRFQFDYSTGLTDALTALGMGVAFDPQQADFSGLSDASTYLSRVQHKTMIEVNEEGTEAAAATSVTVTVTSLPLPQETFEMTVDRPFFFAIRDNQSGALLFLGSVAQPTE